MSKNDIRFARVHFFYMYTKNVEAEARARNILKQLWLGLEKRDQNAAYQKASPTYETENQVKQVMHVIYKEIFYTK